MNPIPIRYRATASATLIALVVSALVPGLAAAATAPITMDIAMGYRCISGQASENSTVAFVWKSADGTRKAKKSIETSAGTWRYCSNDGDLVTAGDRLSANDGASTHLLVVPELTLRIDRVNDRIKGRGPAGDYVRLICGYTNGFEPCQASWKLKVNSEGKWGFTPGWDLVGWQRMFLTWKTGAGDIVSTGAQGPYVDVTIGSPIVRGATHANGRATIVLRRAGSSAVAGTAVLTGNPFDGSFQTKFRNANGQTVKARVGDHITSDVAADEDWIVPNVTGSADAATDIVTGTCPPDTMFVHATVIRNGYPDGGSSGPEEDGSFELDLSYVDVQPGETVRVSCYLLGLGDWAGRAIVAN